MMYRLTNDKKYLDHSLKIADFILDHPNLPKDKIPYWDFDATGIPNVLRDASAGAVIASALIELSTYLDGDLQDKYFSAGEEQVVNLASKKYREYEVGDNHGFILKHSVGFMNKNYEVDAPLSYADYYFVEALIRLKNLNEGKPVVHIYKGE